MKPVRVRKARHSGRCPRCGQWVLVGALIASVRGGPFMCIAHVSREDTDGKGTITMQITVNLTDEEKARLATFGKSDQAVLLAFRQAMEDLGIPPHPGGRCPQEAGCPCGEYNWVVEARARDLLGLDRE